MALKNITGSFELDHSTQQRLVAQWENNGRAFAAAKRQALAGCSPQEQRKAVWDMSQLGGLVAPDPNRENWSGLIEMQRRFARLRERGNK